MNNTTMSEGQYLVDQVRFYSYNVITPALCVFGIICNILNLIVLSRREFHRCPYVYLAAVAVFDNGVLVLYLIYTLFSMNTVTGEESKMWRYYDIIFMVPIINTFTYASIWLIVLISLDRMMFIRAIYRTPVCSSMFWARVKIVSVFLLALMFNIPRFFLFTVDKSVQDNVTKYIYNSTAFRGSSGYYAISWVYATFVHFLPLLTIAGCNIYLIREVLNSRSSTNGLELRESRRTSEEKRVTAMLIAVIVLFLITITPSAFVDRPIAFAMYHGNLTWTQFMHNPTYLIIQTISNVLVVINSALNFLLYCGFNNKFVETLKSIFRDKFKTLQRLVTSNSPDRTLVALYDSNGVHSDNVYQDSVSVNQENALLQTQT